MSFALYILNFFCNYLRDISTLDEHMGFGVIRRRIFTRSRVAEHEAHKIVSSSQGLRIYHFAAITLR
jgi:hypothetical protein